MGTKESIIQGVRLTIIEKPAFEMVGFKKPVNLGDGSIALFLRQLAESGKMQKLADTRRAPQQIWVCLSDCQACGSGCPKTQICCRVCVEKTEDLDLSGLNGDEIFLFRLPESSWVLYETRDAQATRFLHETGVYELVKEIGYQWNEKIRLHFDNEHDCYEHDQWIPGKTYRFLLPVVPI